MFPQIFGKYVLEREIASGGMAIVYLATLRGAGGFEKRLVVKQIRAELASDDAFVRRFVDEAKTTVELGHPNIVPVYELGVEQGVYYIAMELAEGVTLAELLAAGGPLSAEEGAYLGVEICRALDYAHRRASIVHRDVTPRNVLVDEEGAVRLIDFGIAAPATGPDTARQKVFGSPGHMPLEQIEGGRLTPATDVFAVGALLIEAWTGSAPFRRSTAEESDAAIRGPLPRLSETSAELAPLDDLIASAVALDQSDRPQSAEELARPMRAFLKSEDLGDLARRLGRRVAGVRGEHDRRSDGERSPATPVTGPMRPAADGTGTRTFASGAEMKEWTRRFSSRPPNDSEKWAGEGPSSVATMPRSNDAFALQALATSLRNDRATNRDEAPGPSLPQTSARGLGRRAMIFAGSVVAVTIVGAALAQWFRAPEAIARGPSAMVVTGAPAHVPRGMPAVDEIPAGDQGGQARGFSEPALPISDEPKARMVATAPEPLPEVVAAAGGASAGARDSEPVAIDSGVLNLTSDLPATVEIGGRRIGPTPVHGLKRPEGRYAVSFESADLQERVATTVELGGGQTLGVHAEFTRATPTVRLRQ